MAICGNTETASTAARMNGLPRNVNRAMAYAHNPPMATANTVVEKATTSELRIGSQKSRVSKSAR